MTLTGRNLQRSLRKTPELKRVVGAGGRAASAALVLMSRRVHMPGAALKNKALQALSTG